MIYEERFGNVIVTYKGDPEEVEALRCAMRGNEVKKESELYIRIPEESAKAILNYVKDNPKCLDGPLTLLGD